MSIRLISLFCVVVLGAHSMKAMDLSSEKCRAQVAITMMANVHITGLTDDEIQETCRLTRGTLDECRNILSLKQEYLKNIENDGEKKQLVRAYFKNTPEDKWFFVQELMKKAKFGEEVIKDVFESMNRESEPTYVLGDSDEQNSIAYSPVNLNEIEVSVPFDGNVKSFNVFKQMEQLKLESLEQKNNRELDRKIEQQEQLSWDSLLDSKPQQGLPKGLWQSIVGIFKGLFHS